MRCHLGSATRLLLSASIPVLDDGCSVLEPQYGNMETRHYKHSVIPALLSQPIPSTRSRSHDRKSRSRSPLACKRLEEALTLSKLEPQKARLPPPGPSLYCPPHTIPAAYNPTHQRAPTVIHDASVKSSTQPRSPLLFFPDKQWLLHQ
jgi:hypothetical protein